MLTQQKSTRKRLMIVLNPISWDNPDMTKRVKVKSQARIYC